MLTAAWCCDISNVLEVNNQLHYGKMSFMLCKFCGTATDWVPKVQGHRARWDDNWCVEFDDSVFLSVFNWRISDRIIGRIIKNYNINTFCLKIWLLYTIYYCVYNCQIWQFLCVSLLNDSFLTCAWILKIYLHSLQSNIVNTYNIHGECTYVLNMENVSFRV